ncbi:hypothetical protein [Sphingomonas sp.]|jgi:hypothetical protein|uniref:hypothetical protein n=1 Tax=Sphingomonas sp. TaxID=28214 RepID=UPI0025EA01F2|nr:hypothetical protein [Sphingomonas sp.]
MTLIFGTTFVGGAIVGADQKRHLSRSKLDAGRGKKTVVLSRYAAVAKAGIGPHADFIYDLVRDELNGREASAQEVADLLERFSPDVLKKCWADGYEKDTPMNFIVAGLTDGVPTIHSYQAAIAKRTDDEGPGKTLAMGMRPETNDRAYDLVSLHMRRVHDKSMLDVGRWAASIIADEQIDHKYAVDYPLDIAQITSDGVEEQGFVNAPPAGAVVVQILD